jgi:polyisoprenoid-binding protein YceI
MEHLMKQRLVTVLTVIAAIFSFSAQAAKTYTVDPQHTAVVWNISHLGFSTPSGKFMAGAGTLILDEAKPENSKVSVTIPINNLVTGIDELNKHLKGKLFFDVDQFPTATFVSDKVTVVNKKMAKISGILTLHGVSKPITLDVTFNKKGVNPINNKETVGFSAMAQLKRSDFDINTLLPDVGDDVKLNIQAEAYLSH